MGCRAYIYLLIFISPCIINFKQKFTYTDEIYGINFVSQITLIRINLDIAQVFINIKCHLLGT